MLKTAGDDPAAKRKVLKGVWEGFRSGVSDEQLDAVIADLETGTFTRPESVTTLKAAKKFDLGAELSGLTYDQDGLDKFELLKANIISEGYDLTPSQLETMTAVETRLKDKVGEATIFNYAEFLEENRLTSADAVIGAMSVVDNMESARFRNGEKDRANYLADLKDELDKFLKSDLDKEMRKAAANRDPMIFYQRNEDGTLKLTPISVMVDTEGKLTQLGTNTPVNMGDGKLVPSDYDASEFIKIFNKPIMEASQIVEEGVAGLDNLLEYRKLTVENPAAFNTYLQWAQGAGEQILNLGSAFNTLVKGGATFDQVESEMVSNLRGLTGPARDIFVRQLEAAYSLAKLKGSSGQGLSDNELELNLKAVGFGATRAQDALRAINIATKRFMFGVESQRRGIINGIISDEDYVQALEGRDLGRKFTDVVPERFGDRPDISEQLTLALGGDLTISTSTVLNPPPIPSFDEFKQAVIQANPNADPSELTDEKLQQMYNETFPTTE